MKTKGKIIFKYILIGQLRYLYVLFFCFACLGAKNEQYLLWQHNVFANPKWYDTAYKYDEYRVTHSYYNIDSLPGTLKDQLIGMLIEKAGKKWFETIRFLRADIVLANNPGTIKSYYSIWYDFPVGRDDRYVYSLFELLPGTLSLLCYPNIISNPEKRFILPLEDAWGKACSTIKKNKRVRLVSSMLLYSKSCDDFEWHFKYKKRTLNIFRFFKNTFFIQMNAHTGEIYTNEPIELTDNKKLRYRCD